MKPKKLENFELISISLVENPPNPDCKILKILEETK